MSISVHIPSSMPSRAQAATNYRVFRASRTYRRRTRLQQVSTVTGFNADDKNASVPVFARKNSIPRSTVVDDLARFERIKASPLTKSFFESSEGIEFLHLVQVSAHLVFVQRKRCSTRGVAEFYQLSGLSVFTASSPSSHQRFAKLMKKEIVRFGFEEECTLAFNANKKRKSRSLVTNCSAGQNPVWFA